MTDHKAKLWRIGKGAMVAAGGAALAAVTEYVSNTDFGVWSLVVMWAWSNVVNILKTYFVDKK